MISDHLANAIVVSAILIVTMFTISSLVYAVRDIRARLQEIDFELSGLSRRQAEIMSAVETKIVTIETEIRRIQENNPNCQIK